MKIGVKGFVRYKVFSNGKLIEEVKRDNLVVDTGLNAFCRVVSGELDYEVGKIGVGDSSTAPAVDQTTLQGANTLIWSLDSKNQVDSFSFDYAWKLTEDYFNGNIVNEFALFTENETMISRIILTNSINKLDSLSIEGVWTLQLTNL